MDWDSGFDFVGLSGLGRQRIDLMQLSGAFPIKVLGKHQLEQIGATVFCFSVAYSIDHCLSSVAH